MTVYNKQRLTLRDLEEKVQDASVGVGKMMQDEYDYATLLVQIKQARALENILNIRRDTIGKDLNSR